jgi:hypothetical protein
MSAIVQVVIVVVGVFFNMYKHAVSAHLNACSMNI